MVSRKAPWGAKVRPGFEAEKGDSTAEKTGKGRGKALSERDTRLLIGVDGRTPWARRARSVMASFVSDLGGPSVVSAAERALCRRAAVLVVQLEQMEVEMSEGPPTHVTTDLYGRGAGHLRRILVDLGLKRVPRDISPAKNRQEALLELYRIEGKLLPEEEETDGQE